MFVFLITFILLYGGMHAYVFFRMRSAFSTGHLTSVLLVTWMLLMTIAPLLVRFFEHAGQDRAALFIAWLGYVWMGFVFLFVVTLLLMESVCIANWLSNQTYSFAKHGFLSAANTCAIALLVAVIASVYAGFEALRIKSEHVVIRSSKLPIDASRIRIVQVSDIHIGLLLREKRLERILAVIREAQPDILVSTGDLVDGRLSQEDVLLHQKSLAAMLASLPTPSGKFSVTGNHEAYAGLEQALDFTTAAGFRVLRNQSVTLPNGITISGVDDPAITGNSTNAKKQETTLLESAPQSTFNLLLKHRPLIPPESDGRFDLQLSGHVHQGQLFPFNFIVKLRFPIPCGTTTTKAGSQIHVSRGTGTWGPPMRLFAPPEVTVIDIIPAAI